MVYKRPYATEKEFEANSLEEYAEQYTAVGIDHTFYAWPGLKTITKYNEQTPDHFKFAFKATEKVSILKYPNISRYGKDAGKANEGFLNASLFLENFLPAIESIQSKVGVIMFEFSHFYPGSISSGKEFVDRLGAFLGAIRKECALPLAVEIRNQTWLKDPYFAMLEKNQVGHVYNSWTKMPAIGEQLEASRKFTEPQYTSRLLLEPGTKYEEAVEAYAPYEKIQNPLPRVRKDTVKLIIEAIKRKKPAYILVNNRCEGCAPKTIEMILEEIPAWVMEAL